MPELPEVETVRRTLAPSLVGRCPSRVTVRLAKMVGPTQAAFAAGLKSGCIWELERHGKLLMARLTGGGYWTMHLGMTGQIIMAAQKPPVNHIHVTVSFDDGGERLYFRDTRQFGGMQYCSDEAALLAGPLANYGPDALSIGKDKFIESLAHRKGRIKSLLLDQRVLAGVGNIYADESLHRAGLHPLAQPETLNRQQLGRLYDELMATLGEALATGGSSVRNFVDAEGRAGTFQESHRVYQRAGQGCPACGQTIEKIVVGGRSTHFCPACQGEPGKCR